MITTLIASIVISTNCVSFTAKATGIDTVVPVEFIIAGPASDRDYESLFLTDDSLADIVAAMKRAGIPTGKTYDIDKCNLWPIGPIVEFEPKIDTLVKIKEDVDYRLYDTVYTGGNGNFDMPLAVLSTYTLGQSLFTFDDSLDQSVGYGRFIATKQWKKGEDITFKVTWKGRSTVDTTPDFPADKTLAEAVKYAKAVQMLDTRTSKVNGFKDGQFFYQAFLPKEQWKDRKERLVQPIEVQVTATNVVTTVIDEDWSVDGPDPKLTPRVVDFDQAFKEKEKATNVVFFFAPGDTKLERLYELKKRIPASYRNFYVYVD